MKLKSLRDVYIHELKDLLSAEKQLLKALPKMAKAAENEELVSAFQEHAKQTEGHVERLEKILKECGVTARGVTCKAMEGLLAEAEENMKEEAPPEVLDALLILSAQKVEHYEIASYGTARTFAEILGEDEGAETLQQTLDEEFAADEKLSEIAESQVNSEAEEMEEAEAEE